MDMLLSQDAPPRLPSHPPTAQKSLLLVPPGAWYVILLGRHGASRIPTRWGSKPSVETTGKTFDGRAGGLTVRSTRVSPKRRYDSCVLMLSVQACSSRELPGLILRSHQVGGEVASSLMEGNFITSISGAHQGICGQSPHEPAYFF